MIEIKLKIDEKVFSDLKRTISLKIMAGSAYGVTDALVARIVESVENGDKELELKFRKKK